MHGLINRGLQTFVRTHYGPDTWERVCRAAKLPFRNFESMLRYDDSITERVLEESANILNRSRDELLEDFGIFLVSSDHMDAIPRLMRFGGDNFHDFLFSLEDLYDRASYILPAADVPKLELEYVQVDEFILHFDFGHPGYGAIVPGVLRGMADHYKALVVLEQLPSLTRESSQERFRIQIVKHDWPKKRDQEQAIQ